MAIAFCYSAVVVNKIANGAVITDKIANDAVTGIKVLDQAIAYAKLDEDLQILLADIIAANRIFANVINADGTVSCGQLVLDGIAMQPYSAKGAYNNNLDVAAEIF